MAKIMSVPEAIKSMEAKKKDNGTVVLNRFNKKNFNILMTAIANDPAFTEKVAKKVGDNFELEEVLVGQNFRKWCKKLVEKAGIDSKESAVVLESSFKIDDCEPLYDFFVSSLYNYIEAGNKFDLHTKEDFQGSIFLKNIDGFSKTYNSKNPSTGEDLGKVEVTTKKHKKLEVKSPAPSWLSTKKKLK